MRDCIVGSELNLGLPALYGDTAILGVDSCDEMLRSYGRGKSGSNLDVHYTFLGEQRRTNDDAPGTGIEHLLCALDGTNASADLARKPLRDLSNQVGVVALAHRSIKVD